MKSKFFLKKNKENVIRTKDGKEIHGHVKIETYKEGKKIRETDWQENLIMLGTNTGISLLLQRLVGTNTYTANITHADIGTGTTAPAITDTILGVASARAVRGLGSVSGNDADLSFFFPDALLPNDTYTEFGTFVDGTISVDTGQIFNRILFSSPYVKSSGEDTTIRVKFTIQ